jgi:DNA-directed RNA polymerase specialized sigma24 family protein
LRAESRVRPIAGQLASPEADVADRDQLARGFSDLSPEQRTLVVLHFYLGLPIHETALALGLPEGTVKSRLSRTTQQMRATLDAHARLPLPEGRTT